MIHAPGDRGGRVPGIGAARDVLQPLASLRVTQPKMGLPSRSRVASIE